MRQREDLNDEVRLLKEEEQSQRNRLLQEHQLRLKELEESLQLLHSESINRRNFLYYLLSITLCRLKADLWRPALHILLLTKKMVGF